jgi:hypothetical protein
MTLPCSRHFFRSLPLLRPQLPKARLIDILLARGRWCPAWLYAAAFGPVLVSPWWHFILDRRGLRAAFCKKNRKHAQRFWGGVLFLLRIMKDDP